MKSTGSLKGLRVQEPRKRVSRRDSAEFHQYLWENSIKGVLQKTVREMAADLTASFPTIVDTVDKLCVEGRARRVSHRVVQVIDPAEYAGGKRAKASPRVAARIARRPEAK
jgi:hypothetical protein